MGALIPQLQTIIPDFAHHCNSCGAQNAHNMLGTEYYCGNCILTAARGLFKLGPLPEEPKPVEERRTLEL